MSDQRELEWVVPSETPPHVFHVLLNGHFYRGTSPGGHPPTKSRRWTHRYLSKTLAVAPLTVSAWRTGRNFPTVANFYRILVLLFGDEFVTNAEARKLVISYNNQGPFYMPLVAEIDEIDEASIQQVPAAFRFGLVDGKIDAIHEDLSTIDRTTSEGLYFELKEKLVALLARLTRSNIDPHVSVCIRRLSEALACELDDIRPGLVLSRMRSVQAIRDAFGRDDHKELLLPDAIAMIDDVCLTGQDFLATFPIVRRIERERLALGIEKTPDILEGLQAQTEAVQREAAASEVVASGAVEALTQTEPDIKQATTLEQRADLLGDKLLIIRNFVSEAVRSATRKGASAATDVWEIIGPDFEVGARTAARMLPPLAVIALITAIAGPVAGIAGLLRGDLFRPIQKVVGNCPGSRRPRIGGLRVCWGRSWACG